MADSHDSIVPTLARSVLYVDDDPLILRAAKRALFGTDVKLETARSVELGLELLESGEHPVVVSDYRMPGMNGMQFLERVRHKWPDAVLILVSGHAELETVAKAINRVGLFRFLLKPWEGDELQRAILQALEHSELVYAKKSLTRSLGQANAELLAVNQQLDREVHRRTADLLIALLNALDLKGAASSGHLRRTALFARRLALELGLNPEEVLEVERGALLHDVGMLALSALSSRDPDTLSDDERDEMRKHPVLGFEIVRDLQFLGKAREVIRHHHERYDGQGYPDGISGDEIYIGARIVAVVDTYDALTSDRPSHEALGSTAAREVIQARKGSKFDPACVEGLMRIPDSDFDDLRGEASLLV